MVSLSSVLEQVVLSIEARRKRIGKRYRLLIDWEKFLDSWDQQLRWISTMQVMHMTNQWQWPLAFKTVCRNCVGRLQCQRVGSANNDCAHKTIRWLASFTAENFRWIVTLSALISQLLDRLELLVLGSFYSISLEYLHDGIFFDSYISNDISPL